MNRAIAKYLFYSIEYLRREYVYKRLKELERNQYLPKVEILNIQRERLFKLLEFVLRNNPYYREKYRWFDPIDSFSKLPILSKEELRENYKKIISKKTKAPFNLVETSGSTGLPLQFYRDRKIFSYTLASLYRGHRWWGLDVGFKEAMLWGVPISYTNKLKIKIKDLLLNRFREREYNITPDTLFDFFKTVERKQPDYLFGYSSMVYEFALFVQSSNLSGKSLRIKNAICTAEKITAVQRKIIEDVFDCKVVSEYGAAETGIISYECPSGSNHISDDCLYVEIVNDQNKPVPDGEVGKVLVTVLHSFVSPIIRYELGDYAYKSTKECDCGVNLSCLKDIVGRTSDIVLAPDGRAYHSIIFYYIMKDFTEKIGGIKQYKVRQSAIDHLEFHIVLLAGDLEIAESYLRDQIIDKFGRNMYVEFFYHDHLVRECSGKLRDFETKLDTQNLLQKVYMATAK